MLLVLIAFTVLLLIGMPVAFRHRHLRRVVFLLHTELPITLRSAAPYETQNFALLAVPLFISAANFLPQFRHHRNLLKLATV